MSKQVDERVVSMQFDNKNFEKNVSHTMSTLDKFKQKLNLTGASKGLENVNAAAKKVDMNGLASGVETVRTKFSALEVMGVTALANITNSAVNAGKRIVSALTIAPIKTGFNEYELKMGSIQTIMAGTGETLETVNKYLNELNEYSDQTIYSFQDMTSNIGKFTNAGVKLEDAVLAIKGISNEAAVSGANANEASRAMYNFAQALSSGYVKLIDWKSIELANMATIDFKNQLLETAVATGTLTKSADGMYTTLKGNTLSATKNFNDTLQDQWMTSEVLIKTLKKYADTNTDIGKKATQAATEVKTFTQMLDTLKESAQSGWAQTWELIFGDFYEGKTLWTSINKVIGGLLDKISDVRNAIIKSTFAKSFSELGKKVISVLEPIKTTAKSIETVTDAVKDYGKIVDEIIGGKWGNGQARWDKLAESGYDWAHAQNLVNEKLGSSVRHATKYKEAQDAVAVASDKLTETEAERLKQLIKMSDTELEALGYTQEQITAFRDLEKAAKKVGMPISEFIDKLDDIDGKWLLFEGFANIGRSIAAVFDTLKTAWGEIFNPKQESIIEKISECLFNVISAFHRFSRTLLLTNTETGELNENGDKLRRTFKGIFAVLDIILTIVGGPLKIAFKALTKILEAFDLNILDITAYIGDALVKFRDWIDSLIDFDGIIEKITPYLKNATDAVRKWFDSVKPLEKVADIFKKIADKVKELSITLYNTDIVQNLIHGLTNGLKSGAKMVWDGIKNLAKGMIDTIKRVLGIHSPSTEFKEVGENAISGLLLGLKNGAGSIVQVIKDLCSKLVGAFSGLNWANISTIFTNIARIFPKLKIFTYISAIGNIAVESGKDVTTGLANGIGQGASAVLEAIGGIATSLIDTFKNILGIHSPSKVMFALGGFLIAGLIGGLLGGTTDIKTSLETIGKTIVDFFSGLDIGSVIATGTIIASLLMVKKTLDIVKDFASAAKGIGKLTGSLGNLVDTLNNGLAAKFVPSKWTVISNAILKVAIAIGILVAAVVVMTKIETGKLWGAIGALGVIIVAIGALAGIMVGLMAATKLINTGVGIDNVGNTLLKLGVVMVIMVMVIKKAAKMSVGEITQGTLAITAFSGIIVGLMAATKLITGSRNVDKIGPTLIKIATAIGIMMIVAKIAASMTPGELIQGVLAITTFSGIIVGLIAATKLITGTRTVDKIGGTLFKIAAAIGIIILVAKIAASMEPGEIVKGTLTIAAFGGIIVGLMAATKLLGGSKNVDKMGGAILKIAAAIGIMILVAKIAASMEPGEIVKGTLTIAAFSGIIVGLMAATKLITGSKNIDKIGGVLLKIAIVIGVMAASVALLSLIKPEKLAYATGAIAALMGMVSLLLHSSKNMTKAMGPLIVLTTMIAIMAGAIFWVGKLPVESALASSAALSLLVLSLSASLLILSAAGKFSKDALLGVLALTAMAVPLLAFVGVLALMQNIQVAAANVTALIALTTAMTLLLIPLTIVGAFGTAGLPYLGVLALLTMAVPMLAFVGILALMQNIQNANQNAMILVTLMTTMTKCLVAVSLVAPLALLASKAILALVGTITTIGVLMTAIGALVTKFPQLEEFLDKGLPILEKIAYGIGSIFGNMLAGFAVSAMSGLPEMGMLLSQFMINAMPFIAGAKMIDATAMDGVKSLAEVILILTAADVIQGLTSWLTGGSSITKFGEEIAAFGPYLRTFADSVAGIDGTSVQAAATAAKALAEMTATIPNEGGVVGWFAGENSIAKFSESLPGLGSNLKLFSDNVAGVNAESVNAAIEAAKALAEMTATIPNEGGVVGWFAGENSIAKFAGDLPGLGEGLKGFSDNVAGINAENVNAAVNAAKAIVEMSSQIPNEGGVAAWFAGDNSIAKFSSQLGDLGTAISTFATNVGDANVDNINKAVTATKSLSALLSTDISSKSSAMEQFGEKLVTFGKKISEFCKKMSGVKDAAITSAIDKFNQLKNMASTLSVDSISSLTKFSDTLVKVAENGIKEFVAALNSKSVKSDANEAISDLVSATADKIETRSNKNKFKSAGKYLIEGLAEGIRAKKSAATTAAQEVADAVESIIRSAWKINSPSKVFYKIALGIGEGMEYALSDSTAGVKSSARDLADTTSKGFSNAISKINDMFNGTFDAQPTIRPVLDLSDVQAGANSIAGMFSGNRTLAISAPGIGAISASMANRQNGAGDLASAINKLAKSNSGKTGDTYNFNGFNYNEGSDVADAIQTLVRAATIEGRK